MITTRNPLMDLVNGHTYDLDDLALSSINDRSVFEADVTLHREDGAYQGTFARLVTIAIKDMFSDGPFFATLTLEGSDMDMHKLTGCIVGCRIDFAESIHLATLLHGIPAVIEVETETVCGLEF